MLHQFFSTLIIAHVLCGSVALLSFWVPLFARKRRGVHTRFGRVFAWSMMATAVLAGIAATLTILAPVATHPDISARGVLGLRIVGGLMLAYLSAITFVAAFSGLRAIRLRGNHAAHRSASELIANAVALVLAVATLVVGLKYGVALMIALSVIGLTGVPGNLRYIFTPPKTPQDWMYQHLGSMIGAGIAAHTAFLVFGVSRIAPQLANEPVVWLAPAAIGIPASVLWKRRLQRRFARPQRVAGSGQGATATP